VPLEGPVGGGRQFLTQTETALAELPAQDVAAKDSSTGHT